MPSHRSGDGADARAGDRGSCSPTVAMTTTSTAGSSASAGSLRGSPAALGGRAQLRLAARLQAAPDPLRTPRGHPPRATPTGLRPALLPATGCRSEMSCYSAQADSGGRPEWAAQGHHRSTRCRHDPQSSTVRLAAVRPSAFPNFGSDTALHCRDPCRIGRDGGQPRPSVPNLTVRL
jgi:hypothetical protein